MAPRRRDGARKTRERVAGLAEQLAALRTMTVAQLRERYREVFDEPTRSRNKDWLYKKVAWRIQEIDEGGLSEQALARIDALGEDAPLRWRRRATRNGTSAPEPSASQEAPAPRDPRLPPAGTVLARVYDGVEHKVTVLDDGFEYQGQRHASLSKLAKDITGTNWNGFLFWNLQKRSRPDKRRKQA